MKTEEWRKVKEIVIEALEVESGGREEFIKKRCAGAPARVRSEVESLLASETESEAEGFLASPAVVKYAGLFEGHEAAAAEALAGQRVGNYRIVRELGRGGMGAVYLAERADGKFEQRVAVKMLKREFNTRDFRRNFDREKEILAALSHPNIAGLLDAGTTLADGIPYLVMEYIEGTPVDEFCRENALDLDARLKLFNRVADAVAFAHRNLIVHRDLKPSNILVTRDGVPKLLDFGISKLLGAQQQQPAGEERPVTILGAMTPEYASPEQLRGEAVTTATDVYSLGVVLYELLTGRRPFHFKNQSPGEAARLVSERDPPAPSRAISDFGFRISDSKSGGSQSEPSHSGGDRQLCSSNPKSKIQNPKSLKGDLDNIVLKALSKEPERRYKTVEQFSADVWRFIDGLPVMARPQTFPYRAGKFYNRHRASVWAGFLILLSLFAGVAAAVSQARVAREQARIAGEARVAAELETGKAKAEEAKAKAEKEKAEKISRFMAKIISYANPSWFAEGARFGGEAKVIDVMNDLGEKIDAEFAGQPDVQAELHHKFTEVYHFVSKQKPAQQEFFRRKQKFHALRALELRRQFYGERHELVAKDLFYANGFLTDTEQGRARLLMEAIEMMRETNPKNLNLPYMLEAYTARMILPDAEMSHETYRRAVVPQTSENKYQIAERFLTEALPIFREHYAEGNSAIWGNECKLAYARAMQNKFADAEPHYRICKEAEKKLDKYWLNFLTELEKIFEAGHPPPRAR